jgi:hypothetical protein
VTLSGCPCALCRLGPAVLAAEVLGRVRAERPVVGGLGDGNRSWWRVADRAAVGADRPRLYRGRRGLARLAGRVPTAGVARSAVDPDYTATSGLDQDQARAAGVGHGWLAQRGGGR